MNEEIAAAIKNAMAHGSSLDDAVSSFIAAGYNPVEVKESAQSITSGTLTNLSSFAQETQTQSQISEPNQAKPAVPESHDKPVEASKWMKITILILLLFIILFGIYLLIYR